mmetsp:Transcript_18051/g.21193  ORF Transcript_18051/g.21193 Transcript_18051/m.21193 type:complete len:83 (+) Transcript_18051:28-276(+)
MKTFEIPPQILSSTLTRIGASGRDIEENKNGEYKSQYQFIGLFFCEPHDFTSRIWGSVVKTLTDEFKRQDENAFQPILVPML